MENKSIGCSVSECLHYSNGYCSLDQIDVVKSSISNNVETIEYTDCASYECKNK